ncbi:MAG TPA: glutathione S-transferase family protein [Sandaracinaceae bacterium LLY-WYZ-13_1]|nr:glutathione S-transferase family protein [Sandaracinaceae bacterium LLY-WYZ-13_1]
MIELHTMVPAFGLPTFTPFGLKLILYLRMASLPFRIVVEHDPSRGPKGKFPWIVDGERTLADSGFIVRYLEERFNPGLDHHLTAEARARAHALRRMLEESLCFSILYFRWVDDATYRTATDVALVGMPRPVRAVARPLIRRRILRDLRGQGVLRHAPEEVAQLGRADLDALAQQLGDQPHVMGAKPCSLDATVAAFLAVLLRVPFDNPLARAARRHDNLVRYTNRMERVWEAGGAFGERDGASGQGRAPA